MNERYRIYSFSGLTGEREFIVISDRNRADIEGEFALGNICLDNVAEIIGDAGSFPCDKELIVA